MNKQLREQVRLSLLRHLDANNSQYGLTSRLLLQQIHSDGFRTVEPAALQNELIYLADKLLVKQIDKLLSPEVEAWRITAAGRDYFAQNDPD